MTGRGQVASRSLSLTTGKMLFHLNFQTWQKHLIFLFDQGGKAGRQGRGLHWDPQQLLQRRHQVARHRMQAQEANHLSGLLNLLINVQLQCFLAGKKFTLFIIFHNSKYNLYALESLSECSIVI